MSAEDWEGMREASKEKKASNEQSSLEILERAGYDVRVLNASVRHYRVGIWDFWPSTGRYYHQQSGRGGRGVFNLIKELKKQHHG